MYSCLAVKGNDAYEGMYLVGDEYGNTSKYKMDYAK
jgi:hypothetical protein